MFVLITGSRLWTDKNLIETELKKLQDIYMAVTIIHGACDRGADQIADEIAQQLGFKVERYPADWGRYGKGAGYKRNYKMVHQGDAGRCLAFIVNNSKGATHCADLAEMAGIPTTRFNQTIPVRAAEYDNFDHID